VSERAPHDPRDAATGSDEQTTRPGGQNRSTPAWIPTDDVITERRDRQILVVGDSVVGLVLTLLLQNAGYDPLIVSGAAHPVSSRVTYLGPPAVRTLDAAGVDSSVRDCGTTVESVSVEDSPSQDEPTVLSTETEPAETLPVVVRTARLRRALEAQLPARQHGGDRAVETISRRDGGLVVEFGDGIREWFDVVVDAGGGGDALRSAGVVSPTADALAQYEIALDTDSLTRAGIRDHWRSDALVQAFQSPNRSGSVLRVTAPPSEVDRVLDEANWEAVLRNGTNVTSGGAEFERKSVRQARASDAVTDWWGTGRVAFCGHAACPVAPASGFDVTFGIEDAVAFVTELTGATRDVSNIVDGYSSRRADRLRTLRETTETADPHHQYPMSRSTRPPLDSLGALRAVTLGSFLGTPMASLQRDGFRAT
jgi:2-polyprenyl-6-methoxyphenol hydroxylase-like FAD-dependent oxidoreductase